MSVTAMRLFHGGPFYRLQQSLGLVGDGDLRPVLRALIAAAIGLLIPLAVTAMSSSGIPWAFLNDPGIWAKFLIAPVLFLIAEPQIERATDRAVAILATRPMTTAEGRAAFESALDRARRLKASGTAELVCLLVAIGVTGLNVWRFDNGVSPSWATGAIPAAWWCVVVSNTLTFFLLARLVWRHLVWAMFLAELSKTRLRLAAGHPDGHGGLGFLASYPSGYLAFNLAVSSVVAAAIAHQMSDGTVSLKVFSTVSAVWLCVVVAYYAIPLLAPGRQIARLKKETIEMALSRAVSFERVAEKKALGTNVFADAAETETPVPSDTRSVYQAGTKLSAILIGKSNVLPLLAGALLPLALVGISLFPMADVWPVFKRLLLL